MPLFDQDYATAAQEWITGLLAWENGTYSGPGNYTVESLKREGIGYFWDYHGMPPDQEFYRPKWSAKEATCYQIYETVSEGTPISPVFETLDELVAWLVDRGHTKRAAKQFAKLGWAPSGVMVLNRGRNPKFATGIEALPHLHNPTAKRQ